MADLHALVREARAWPYEEARRLVDRLGGRAPEKGYALFQTGYGPSGLPHIGTFGEVVRTTMVRQAFEDLAPDLETRLFAFSDDMDGMRSVPDNIPNAESLAEHVGKPLTSVPDPFGTHESFGHHNNALLRAFLDRFGFDYEFKSATECYRSGEFDEMLLAVLRRHDEIVAVIAPTLGRERRETYSPFLPLCPRTGRVLLARVAATDPDAGTIVYEDEDGAKVETPVTGGRCKLQWKADWAMRWAALAVDYEMSGKDLIDSVRLSGRICRILGGAPPAGFTYELFLDENGEKISKSRGNGLTVDEWLDYAPASSLGLYMYNAPRKAKRLYFDVIPRHVDDWARHLESFADQDWAARIENPYWHLRDILPRAGGAKRGAARPSRREILGGAELDAGGEADGGRSPVAFGLLLNLAAVCNTEDPAVLWGFVSRYAPGTGSEDDPGLDALIGHAIAYYRDFVKPKKSYRLPDEAERGALAALLARLERLPADAGPESIQSEIYEVGKACGYENLREWFAMLYEVLLGQSQGPRFGSFVALYGIAEMAALIRRVCDGESIAAE